MHGKCTAPPHHSLVDNMYKLFERLLAYLVAINDEGTTHL